MNRGGAETLIMNLYRNIDRTKVQFDFLTCKEGVFDSEIIEMGGRIHRIPYVTNAGHFGYIKALDDFFHHHQEYKIVHSHMDKMSGLVLRAAKKARVPNRIAHSHNTSSEGGLAAKIYKSYIGNFISSSATHFLACSQSAAKWLFAEDHITIIKNGIDCCKFTYSEKVRADIRRDIDLASNDFVIGHVGRFFEQKNHAFIMDIFAQANRIKPNSKLVLVGEGPLRPVVEKKAQNLGITNNIRFLGGRGDVHRILQGLDVLLFPSLHEGLPVTLIEAQGAGLPCLISDVITKEVDMGAGLVQYQSLNDPVETWVRKLVEMKRSPKETKGFIKRKGYDIQGTAIFLENYYLDIIKENIHVQNFMLS